MDRYDVFIAGFPDTAPQPPVVTLQRVLGLSESEAQKLVGSFPCAVLAHQDGPTVQRVGKALKQAGALVELRVSTASPAAQAPIEAKPAAPYVLGDLVLEPGPPARAPQAPPAEPVAPPPSKPEENTATGKVQMLADGFEEEGEQGPALELDYEAGVRKSRPTTEGKIAAPAGGTQTSRTTAAKSAGDRDNARDTQPEPVAGHKYAVQGGKAAGPRRGRIHVRDRGPAAKGLLLGTVLPIALVLAALAGAYKYVGPLIDPAARPPRQSVLARRRNRAVLAATAAPSAPVEVATGAAGDSAPPPVTGQDDSEVSDSEAKEPGAGASVLEWAVAAELRARMHGVHKADVRWPSANKSSVQVECVLLDRKYESRLPSLEQTGKRVEPSAEVAKQLAARVAELKASKRYQDREFLPVCLAN